MTGKQGRVAALVDRRLGAAEDLLATVIASRWDASRLDGLAHLAKRVGVEDWRRCIASHGLAGVIALKHRVALERLPDELAAVPVALHKAHVPYALQQFRILNHAHQALLAAGVPHLPLKGLFLSLHLYGDIAVRHSSDIDVLIDPADFDAAYTALVASGFRSAKVEYDGSAPLRRLLLRSTQHLEMISPEGQLLELHWRDERTVSASLPPLKTYVDSLHTVAHGPLSLPVLDDDRLRQSISRHAVGSGCRSWKWGYDVLELGAMDSRDGTPWGSRHRDGDWALDVCLGIMARQLSVTDHHAYAGRRRHIEAIGAQGVRQRASLVADSSQSLTETLPQKLRSYQSLLYLEGNFAQQLLAIGRFAFDYWPGKNPRVARLVARLPALIPVVKLAGLLPSLLRPLYKTAHQQSRSQT